MDIGNGLLLGKVNKFMYLPILTGKGFLLKLKAEAHTSCVKSCLKHCSETAMKVEHEKVRW